MRLHDFLDYRVREGGVGEFAVEGDRRITYAQAYETTCRLANAFVQSGLEVGDRIGVLSKNSIEMALLYYGASRAGVVPVPLNYRLAPPEWAYIIEDSGAKMLLAQSDLASALMGAAGDLASVRTRVVLGGEVPGWTSWDAFLADAPANDPLRSVGADDDAYQMYTSGTTGRPKGAVLTHRAVSSQLHQAMVGFGSEKGERVLVVAPMYHAAAALTTFVTVQAGGTLFIHADFDPHAVVRALAEDRIGMTMLVPAMIQFCLVTVPDVRERRYDDLRLVVYGASPIAEATLRDAMDVFGCEFLQGYGMTETTAALTYLMPEDHRRALAGEPHLLQAAGRPLLGTELRIVDADDKPVASGVVGEICGRGPQLMRGYWNLPEATARALKDGWMHTGDAGTLDDEGFLYIQDRVKDMIVSGGENVYPREVEDVLYQHPAVAEAAVIGVPSDTWGEEVKAVIVRKPGVSTTAEDILTFCKGRLGGYKRPRSVDFVDALPRNPSGKVLKKDLREPYWQGRQRRVG